MRSAVRAMLVCAAVLGAAVPSAQGQGAARDAKTAGTPAKGTAELSVLVTTDESNARPLRRVSVAIQAGEIDIPNIAVTDDDGRVVFRNLAAGNYLLTAMRSGYVRTFYGSKLPGRGPGIPVTVLDGQKVANVRIRLLRGGVITGTIRTAAGRPALNQAVQAVMVKSASGDRRAVNLEGGLGGATTDDRGVYRIFGLAPGDYIVLVPSTVIGAADELRPMTTAELKWADSVVAGGIAAAPATGVPAAPASAAAVSYAPVYFPGTAVATDAGVITLGPNEERRGVDFGLQLVPTAQISGRLVDAGGRPQNGVGITLRPVRPDGLDLFSSLFNATGRTTTDGTFTIRGVKPGSYTLSVRSKPQTDDPSADPKAQQKVEIGQAFAALGLGGVSDATHWASEDVTVQGRDITDMVLTLRPGMMVTGKIVYEATTKTAPTDVSKTGLVLMTAPTGTGMNDLVSSLGGATSTSPTITPEGAFTIRGVMPGRYRLNLPFAMMPLPGMSAFTGGWTLKSVMANGRDIADEPIEIRAGVDVSNVVVTFTDQPSELSGTVLDGAGRVTPDFPIIVFSTDRAYWTLGSRRVQTARPSSDGRFKVTGLPAGEYFVCAVTMVDRTEVYDPAFLSQLTGVSFKITIKDGEKKTVDLKLGGG